MCDVRGENAFVGRESCDSGLLRVGSDAAPDITQSDINLFSYVVLILDIKGNMPFRLCLYENSNVFKIKTLATVGKNSSFAFHSDFFVTTNAINI